MHPPADITVPDAGSKTAQAWLGRYLRRLLADLVALPMGRFDARTFDAFADLRAHLTRLARDGKAGLVFSIVRRPTTSTLLRCLQSELYGRGDVRKLDDWLAELTTLLAFDLAAARELPPGGMLLPARTRTIHSPMSGLRLRVSDEVRLGVGAGEVVLERAGGRRAFSISDLSAGSAAPDPALAVDHPYHSIADGLCLATADNNPLSEFEAHPDKSGNTIDLGGRAPDEWVAALRAALDLVDAHLPELGREIRLVMHTLVPVGYDPERHLSASYAEAIGTAYLSLHPDAMTMTEALIHEFSHNKLNLLWALDPVLLNAFDPLFSSPVRPDPRPLHGIMLAVHAFVPVAVLYARLFAVGHPLVASAGARHRFEQIVDGNHEGTRTLLDHAEPTDVGRGILDELARWDRHFAR